jgi:hypothetical protein
MMAATIGKPPAKAAIGAPPPPEDTKGNIEAQDDFIMVRRKVKPKTFRGEPTQLNVRLDPKIHSEIKIAAIHSGKSLADYLVMIHEDFQRKTKGA